MKILAKIPRLHKDRSELVEMDLFDTERNPLVFPEAAESVGERWIYKDFAPGIPSGGIIPGVDAVGSGDAYYNEVGFHIDYVSYCLLFGAVKINIPSGADGSKSVSFRTQMIKQGGGGSGAVIEDSVSPISNASGYWIGEGAIAAFTATPGDYDIAGWIWKSDSSLAARIVRVGWMIALLPCVDQSELIGV